MLGKGCDACPPVLVTRWRTAVLEPQERGSTSAKDSASGGRDEAAQTDAKTASEWLMSAFKKMVTNQVSFTPQGRALQRDVSL